MTTESTLATGLGTVGQGTVVSLIVRKKGVLRGPTGNQKVYGDDLVHVLLWSGFHYKALAERSYKKLLEIQSSGHLYTDLVKAARSKGAEEATIEDACAAVQEVADSLRLASLAPDRDIPLLTSNDGPSGVWKPLVVDGEVVVGAKVYDGPEGLRQDGPLAPTPGAIYLDAVKLGEVVLNPAPNGPWEVKSSPKTVVKDLVKAMLPSGLFVRYCLNESNLLAVKTGKAASLSAKRGGVQVNAEAVRSLFKIAS